MSYNESAVFTCAPTSNNCLIFGLADIENNIEIVGVNTFRVGETKWKTTHFPSPECSFAYNSKIIFSRGIFYCLGGLGSLAGFNPFKKTWTTYPMKCGGNVPNLKTMGRETYLVEIKGEIFFLNSFGEKLRLFRLNHGEIWDWEEKYTVDKGLTFFGASRASEFISDLPNNMKNKIFLSSLHNPVIQTYCLDEGRYHLSSSSLPSFDEDNFPKNFQSIWIEPPKQLLDLS